MNAALMEKQERVVSEWVVSTSTVSSDRKMHVSAVTFCWLSAWPGYSNAYLGLSPVCLTYVEKLPFV
jgi:hypothetical protein